MTENAYKDNTLYDKARYHSFYNYEEVIKSKYAGCYHCKRYFETNTINEEEHCIATTPHGTQEPTVFCPFCGIDAIIGDASGYQVTDLNFLNYMNDKAFSPIE